MSFGRVFRPWAVPSKDDFGILRRLVGLSTPVKFLICPASAFL